MIEVTTQVEVLCCEIPHREFLDSGKLIFHK